MHIPTSNDTISSKKHTFNEFHGRVGAKQFSPEFLGSLVAVMMYADCLAERIHAWCRWRSWANFSEFACAGNWASAGEALDQTDCAVDLAWFAAGKSAEEIIRAPESTRRQAREPAKRMRSQFCKAFAKLQTENRVEFRGRAIYPVVAPESPETPEKVAGPHNFQDDDEAFFAWWKVASPDNFARWEAARTAWNEVRKLERTARRECRIQLTSESVNGNVCNENEAAPLRKKEREEEEEGKQAATAAILSSECLLSGLVAETLSFFPEEAKQATVASFPAALPAPEPETETAAAAVPAPPPPVTEQEIVATALRKYGHADEPTVQRVIDRTREVTPDATAEEIADAIQTKGASIGRHVKSIIGILVTSVPFAVRQARVLAKSACSGASYLRRGTCPKCRGSGWIGATGSDLRTCDCAHGIREAEKYDIPPPE